LKDTIKSKKENSTMSNLTRLTPILIGILCISNITFAQIDEETIAKNRPSSSFSLNALDGATMGSLQYEVLFAKRTTSFFAFGFGGGFTGDLSEFKSKEKYLTLPHHFTYCAGKKSHFLEFGITASYIPENKEKNYQLGPIFGYRYQPLKAKKLNARIFASVPFIKVDLDMYYSPIGVSIGYCF
jgi:hypothetical protein